MEQGIIELAIAVARDSPALATAGLIVVAALAIWVRISPAVVDYYAKRTEREEAREIRKRSESEDRAKLEGQWLESQKRATQAIETSNGLVKRMVDKLEEDNTRSDRIEGRLAKIDGQMGQMANEIHLIKEMVK